MKFIEFLTVLFVFLLVFSLFLPSILSPKQSRVDTGNGVFFGVDIAYGDLAAAKSRIDEVSSYTNLVVIGSTAVTFDQVEGNTSVKFNPERATEICQYAYDQDMSFMIYSSNRLQQQWVEEAVKRWGNKFLGIYVWDEPGGKQLDHTEDMMVRRASDPTHVEQAFVRMLKWGINFTVNYTTPSASIVLPSFTSDYALYWFDYEAGYKALFAEFGWNYSRELNIGLVRGAATVQNKDWGAIMAWTYTSPPYIESGELLYQDMKLAYDNGAKYILVFDANNNWTKGILKEEHFQAMQQFWEYMQDTPRPDNSPIDRAVYVLPDNYAYGFRGPGDKIWGLWEADDFAVQICADLYSFMEKHGSKLDIIYDDPATANFTSAYGKTVYWNATDYNG